MLTALLQNVAVSETNSTCGPREPDDMTPCQYCFLGHVTRTADPPLRLHQPSSSAEKIAPHSVDSPPNIIHIKENIGSVRVAVKDDSLLPYYFESA